MIAITTTRDGQVVLPPFSWSYSRIKNFDTCPRRYNEIDVLKNFKEPKSHHLTEGFAVHSALAERIARRIPLPSGMPYEKWAEYAVEGGGDIQVEPRLAMTEAFTPCDYFDKEKPVWLRAVADVLRVKGDLAHIIDWKTGKIAPDTDQLMLIATCVMAHRSAVYNIKAELIWLAHDAKTSMECTVDDIIKFWGDKMFDKVNKLRQAHADNHFPPKTSGLCKRWCVVTSCEHCGQ